MDEGKFDGVFHYFKNIFLSVTRLFIITLFVVLFLLFAWKFSLYIGVDFLNQSHLRSQMKSVNDETAKRAFVWGINDYKHLSSITDMINDVDSVTSVLKDLGFDVHQERYVKYSHIRERMQKRMTRSMFEKEFDDFLSWGERFKNRNVVTFFFFTGRGYSDLNGDELCFAPLDFDGGADSLIYLSEILRKLKESESKRSNVNSTTHVLFFGPSSYDSVCSSSGNSIRTYLDGDSNTCGTGNVLTFTKVQEPNKSGNIQSYNHLQDKNRNGQSVYFTFFEESVYGVYSENEPITMKKVVEKINESIRKSGEIVEFFEISNYAEAEEIPLLEQDVFYF